MRRVQKGAIQGPFRFAKLPVFNRHGTFYKGSR